MAETLAGMYVDDFFDTEGFPLRGRAITVYERGTTILATLYTSSTKQSVAPNPFTTDDDGNGYFYTDPGEYDLFFLNTRKPIVVNDHPDEPETGGTTTVVTEGGVTTVTGPPGPAGATGAAGAAGAQGPAGPGVPTGGAAGMALLKLSTSDYSTYWAYTMQTNGARSFVESTTQPTGQVDGDLWLDQGEE